MNKTKSNGVIHHSIDFRKEDWEDPDKFGTAIAFLIDATMNDFEFYYGRQEKPKHVFIKSEEMKSLVGDPDNSDRLNFVFECYDVADEEEEQIFISKLDDKDRESYELGKSWEKQDGR